MVDRGSGGIRGRRGSGGMTPRLTDDFVWRSAVDADHFDSIEPWGLACCWDFDDFIGFNPRIMVRHDSDGFWLRSMKSRRSRIEWRIHGWILRADLLWRRIRYLARYGRWL